MDKVENLEDVWDNGHVAPASLSGEALDLFKEKTKAKRVVARQWLYRGKKHRTPYLVHLLPDETGLIHYDRNDPQTKRLVVLNGDESRRLVIEGPRVDSRSHPESGYLSLPPSSAQFGEIEWGCEGNDGNTDYLFEFDWRTGKLLRFSKPSRPW